MRVRQIDRYLFLAGARLFFAYLALLFLILLLERSVRLLQQMQLLGLGSSHLLPLIAAMAPFSLSLAVPVTFAMALVVLADRLTREREIECLLGLGRPPWRIALPLVALGLTACAASLLVSGWIEPRGRHAYREEMALARNRIDPSALRAGAIHEFGPALMLSARVASETGLEQVLVWSRDSGGVESILTARRGALVVDRETDSVSLHLDDGTALVGRPFDQQEAREAAFARLVLTEDQQESARRWARGRDALEQTLPELIATGRTAQADALRREAIAEAWRRIARALTIPLIPLLVLPLIAASPPGRRAPAVFLIAALLIAGHHGINLAHGLGSDGTGPPALPLQVLILAQVLLVAVVWLLGRNLAGVSQLGVLAGIRLHFPASNRSGRGGRDLPAVAMPAIARLIAGRVLRNTFAGLILMASVFGLIDVIEAGDVMAKAGAGLTGMVHFLILRAPSALVQAMPAAALGGPLIAFFTLRDSRELLIVQTLGLSAFRILRIACVPAAALALFGMVLAETLVPRSEAAFSRWWHTVEQAAGEKVADKPGWLRVDGQLVRFDGAAADGTRLRDLLIINQGADGRLASVLRARQAVRGDDGWMLFQTERQGLGEGAPRLRSEQLRWGTSLSPADVRRIVDRAANEAPGLARRVLREGAAANRARAYFATRLAYRWAFPAMPFVMLLLAMPVVFASQQPRKIALSLAMAAMAGMLFLVVDGVMRIMGSVGEIPPWLAVWSAPLLFGLVGLRALLRSERIA